MRANRIPIINTGFTKGDSGLAQRLQREIEGEVLFDAFSRGRYSTDASHYQIEPLGVVVAKTEQDVRTTMEIASGCGSTGWVFSTGAQHQWQLGMYPRQAQDEVWKDTPTALAGSSYAPTGVATVTDGGFRANG